MADRASSKIPGQFHRLLDRSFTAAGAGGGAAGPAPALAWAARRGPALAWAARRAAPAPPPLLGLCRGRTARRLRTGLGVRAAGGCRRQRPARAGLTFPRLARGAAPVKRQPVTWGPRRGSVGGRWVDVGGARRQSTCPAVCRRTSQSISERRQEHGRGHYRHQQTASPPPSAFRKPLPATLLRWRLGCHGPLGGGRAGGSA